MRKSRKRAPAKSGDDAAQLRHIADNVPAMSIAYDENLRCLFANRRFAEFFGLTTASIVGKHLREIIGEAPYREVKPHFDRVLEGHRTTYKRTRVLDDGEPRYLEVELTPHIGQDGRTRGLFAVTTDVTERVRVEEQLRETDKRLRDANEQLQMLIRCSPLAIYTRDPNGLLTSWNPAAEKMYGWKAAEVLGKPLPSVPDESRESSDGLRARLLAGESFIKHEARRRKRDGSPLDIDAFLGPLRDAAGNIHGIIAMVADITERKQAEKALRDGEAELRLLTDIVPAMISYVDRRMNCVFANKRYADFFGLAVADLVGKPLREIVGEADYAELQAHFAEALQGHPVSFQWNAKRRDGEQRCIEVQLVPRAAGEGQVPGCYSMAIDISEQKRAEERIRHVADHDSLTGLPNRLLFNDRLSHAISIAKRDAGHCALLYLDLDRFKPVNDTYGHDAGDQVLKMVAERIRGQVRESDTVARVGGDEFTVILHDISSPQNAAAVAQKIIAALTAPFHLGRGSQEISIGSSIGITVYPINGQDHDTLIRKADAAMYSAKVRGNSFRFSGT
jgi:diguanylate cyclase (GGDEF)-like protein/PAS domain S-box-containing protein